MFNWLFKKVVTLREKVAVDLGGGDVEKPFLDHLDDLRTMITRIAITLIAVTLLTFVYVKELMAIIEYPLTMAGIAEHVSLQNLKVTGGFMTAMNISLVAGVILAFPLLLYFVLQFVLPGLRSNEKKVIFPALGVGAGLFMVGVVFAYYVVTPRALTFFYEFSRDIGSSPSKKVEEVQKEAVATGQTTNGAATPAGPVEILGTDGKIYVKCCQACTCGMPAGVVAAAPAPATPGTAATTVTPAPAAPGTAATTVMPAPGSPSPPGTVAVTPPAPAPGSPAPGSPAAPGPAATSTAAAPEATTAAGVVAASATAPTTFIWELTEYVKFICQFVLIFGACFELPVVVMAMVKMDVLNYKVMKTTRAWAAIIIAVAAALITPTQDALTLGLLAVPMYLLYEICIWLAWWMEKRDRKLYPEYYKEMDEDAKALEVSDDWDNDTYNPWGGSGNADDDNDDDDTRPKGSPKPAGPSAGAGAAVSGSAESTPEVPATSIPSDEYAPESSSLDAPETKPEPGSSTSQQPHDDDDKFKGPSGEAPEVANGEAEPGADPDKRGEVKPGKEPEPPSADKRDTD